MGSYLATQYATIGNIRHDSSDRNGCDTIRMELEQDAVEDELRQRSDKLHHHFACINKESHAKVSDTVNVATDVAKDEETFQDKVDYAVQSPNRNTKSSIRMEI